MQEFCKEVCVDNIKDAMRAVDLGANRIEYCSKLNEEGLTPDIEDVKYLLKNINIPLRIMIRPHSKSFNYSEKDISIMLRGCLLYTSPSPRDEKVSRMPSSA